MLSFSVAKMLNTPEHPLALRAEFALPAGQWLLLTGESGAGKTTLLRLLAGLERPESGYIRLGDQVWYDAARGIHLRPEQRKAGLVFQDYALFPHLDVLGNVAFGLARRQRSAAHRWVERVGLAEVMWQKPRQLSGGQQQRAAIARALVRQPSLLLLDEPLSALDASNRQKMMHLLHQVKAQGQTIAIIVAHHIPDFLPLADHHLGLANGRLTTPQPTTPPLAAASPIKGQVISQNPTTLQIRLESGGDHSFGIGEEVFLQKKKDGGQ